jgi:hypothetical protein
VGLTWTACAVRVRAAPTSAVPLGVIGLIAAVKGDDGPPGNGGVGDEPLQPNAITMQAKASNLPAPEGFARIRTSLGR